MYVSDDTNKESIEEIETCGFLVCLDEKELPAYKFNLPRTGLRSQDGKGHIVNETDETNMLHQMLHGGGSTLNTGNRWFDKTVQVSQIANANRIFSSQC